MGKSKGYSLVELMVTAAVIAALASIAIPAFSHYISKAEDANQKASYRENRAEAIMLEFRESTGR